MTVAPRQGQAAVQAPHPDTGSLACPLPRCRAVNDAAAETCRQCQTPLRAYARLRSHPARLFNEGLAAAREGRIGAARDRFAAIVHWCPHDTEARSALALACLLQSDPGEARHHWNLVLERRPSDAAALRGLAMLTRGPDPAPVPARADETAETGETEAAAEPVPEQPADDVRTNPADAQTDKEPEPEPGPGTEKAKEKGREKDEPDEPDGTGGTGGTGGDEATPAADDGSAAPAPTTA
ncbi:hypothetical protein [Streptomyces sp. NPDC050560]|uniref:hypothetical protein n=1 Tax=Streptomyces sp. NPDC050560 TaxID=3365630 RepID=UPI00378B3DF9